MIKNKRIIKYNPSFLSEQELIESFVARYTGLNSIIKVIEENSGNSNQHLMIIGTRGSGKTTLVLRAAVEARNNKKLSDKWYPLIFAEESYQVSSPGEFWLEAVFHLSQQIGTKEWNDTYEELAKEQDEFRLNERALNRLLDFADEQKKRILLIVENFNMLLGEQISDDDAWKLRHVLQDEPRIMLLATATSRFNEIEKSNKAMFELFKQYELNPLNNNDCRLIWKSITSEELNDERIRPIKILTGGNPRLLTIISSFGANLSFKELMQKLIQLVDDHTEYFKSHLDNISPQERKVYLALAEIWDPAISKEISKYARININKTSSILNRLVARGAVVVQDQKGGKKWYQLSERLYNIYYLMRRRGGNLKRVQAVVNFMINFYEYEDIINITKNIANEVCELPSEYRIDHFSAYESIIKQISNSNIIVKETASKFFILPDIPDSLINFLKDKLKVVNSTMRDELKCSIKKMIKEDIRYSKLINSILIEGIYKKIEQIYRKFIESNPNKINSLLEHFGENSYEVILFTLKVLKTSEEQSKFYEKLEQDLRKSELFREAEQIHGRTIKHKSEREIIWRKFGLFLHNLKRCEEAEQAYRKAIEIYPDNSSSQHSLASILTASGKWEEALEPAKKYLEDSKNVEGTLDSAIDLFIGLTAKGYGKQSLDILKNSHSSMILEPLIAAIQLYLGEDIKAPIEIIEIADDIVNKINMQVKIGI
ncbi:ATP-binding protein [Candidatus Desantisbacteria bacterium]|nr:ATP-binding protein [Candidatus Desantisbacteria bacterium]